MMNYKKEVEKVIDRIKKDQTEHLRNNCDNVYQSVAETSTFNDAFIDATRAAITALKQALYDIEKIEEHFNKE